jgi:hypothetical protein
MVGLPAIQCHPYLLTSLVQTSSTSLSTACLPPRSSLHSFFTQVSQRPPVHLALSHYLVHAHTHPVTGSADELTSQAVFAFMTFKPYVPPSLFPSLPLPPCRSPPHSEFKYDPNNEGALAKELILQVCSHRLIRRAEESLHRHGPAQDAFWQGASCRFFLFLFFFVFIVVRGNRLCAALCVSNRAFMYFIPSF